ncbi:hypothetical protein [Actinoplanes sp. GCM10030250]|uniref:hypothetical protein n=1 Tax=Actinoplanes sp. GCM10030250 TaxID=3273376 RepID=UPI00361A6145
MPTIWEYAEQVAAGDTGRWQAATRRTAILLAPTHPMIDLPHRMPVHQVLVQTTALVVHGLAMTAHTQGHMVTTRELAAWVTDHAVPPIPATPELSPEPSRPEPASPAPASPAPASPQPASPQPAAGAPPGRLLEIARAVRRQQDGLAALLRAAGHQVPDPGVRSLRHHSPDPVIRQWHDLADVDDEDLSTPGGFRGPLLCLGIAAMADTFGPAII